MKLIENKKIPTIMIIISFLMIIFFSLIKTSVVTSESTYDADIVETTYKVLIFGNEFNFSTIVSILMIPIIIGVILFIYTNDDEIKNSKFTTFNYWRQTLISRFKLTKSIKNTELSDNQKLANRIKIFKNICLFIGVFMIFTNYNLKNSFKEFAAKEIKELKLNYNPYNLSLEEKMHDKNYFKVGSIYSKYESYSLFLDIFNVIIAFVCLILVNKYNNFNLMCVLALLCIAFPNIALIIAGLKITLKNEYKLLLTD